MVHYLSFTSRFIPAYPLLMNREGALLREEGAANAGLVTPSWTGDQEAASLDAPTVRGRLPATLKPTLQALASCSTLLAAISSPTVEL